MKIPKDKQGHLFVGAVIALGTGWISLTFAAVAVTIFALGKEGYDWFYPEKHSVELMDAVATFIGGAIGILPYIIIG